MFLISGKGVFWWGDCRDIDTTIVMVSFCGGPATARRLLAGEVDGLFFFFTADTLFDVRWWGGYKPSPPPIMYNYALFVVLHMRAQNLHTRAHNQHTRAHNQYYGWCRLFFGSVPDASCRGIIVQFCRGCPGWCQTMYIPWPGDDGESWNGNTAGGGGSFAR